VGRNQYYYLADSYIDISPIVRTDGFILIPLAASPEATEERARELLKQEKFDPVELLNLIGGKSWRKEKSRAFRERQCTRQY
jgi:hypothetical protein